MSPRPARRPTPPTTAPGGYVSARERALSGEMLATGARLAGVRCWDCMDTGRRQRWCCSIGGGPCDECGGVNGQPCPSCEAGRRVAQGEEIDGG